MNAFLKYKATQSLARLAKTPYDLTLPNHLTTERLQKFKAQALDYTLFYGTERITEEVLDNLYALSVEAKALEKMQQMQSGEIINKIEGFPSENRSVLHTATRDFFDSIQTSSKAKDAAKQALEQVHKLRDFIKEIDAEGQYTDLVLVGIGGSDLGPRAHYIALQYLLKPHRKVHFISNVDPDDASIVMKDINLAKTLVVIVSKTGTTLETATNEAIVRNYFVKSSIDPKRQMISVTMPGSPMDDLSKYRACFHIWDWVGGRYSTTSMVGGVLLAFAYGFDVFWDFLKGANAMDKLALSKNRNENLPLLAALLGIWNRNFLNYSTLAIIPYSQALLRYPAHIQQLDMESNGKQIDKQGNPVSFETGPIIWGEIGTNSQHSFFQLLHQGTTIVPIEFVGFKQSQFGENFKYQKTDSQQKLLANLFAQILALAQGKQDQNPNKNFKGNRPSHLLLGNKLTPYALGGLLAFFEHKVAFQGFIWDINSFDQEGVQLGKVLANKILDHFLHVQEFPLVDCFLT